MFNFFHKIFFRHKPLWKSVPTQSFTSGDISLERCETCGAIVADPYLHSDWHDQHPEH